MNTNIKTGDTCEFITKEIEAASLLRKQKRTDSWFVSRYGMNLYRGCTHNCAYCDGRADTYNVEGDFGKKVEVKVNAPELLKKELDPARKRKPMQRGFIMTGGGVGDSYQPVEQQYGITRKILEIIHEHGFPVHILTKSILVEKDMDILKTINNKTRTIVSFSLSSADDEISAVFEPCASPPSERLSAIARLKKQGLYCGVYYMPVIPFVTDTPVQIARTLDKIREAGADFVLFAGMTMKTGRQRDYYYDLLRNYNPDLITRYDQIYSENKWGQASPGYYKHLNDLYRMVSARYKIPRRIPASLFHDMVEENDLVAVILEQLDYLVKSRGQKSPYGYAAYSVSQLKEPVSSLKNNLQQLKGVGKFTEKIILEILEKGSAGYYEGMLRG